LKDSGGLAWGGDASSIPSVIENRSKRHREKPRKTGAGGRGPAIVAIFSEYGVGFAGVWVEDGTTKTGVDAWSDILLELTATHFSHQRAPVHKRLTR